MLKIAWACGVHRCMWPGAGSGGPGSPAEPGTACRLAGGQRISKRFLSVTSFMIGRGVFANPFLAEQMKEMKLASAEEQRNRFIHFVTVLMAELKKEARSPHFLFCRLKDYWGFFSYLFYDSEKIYQKLVRIQDEEAFFLEQGKILNKGSWRDLNVTETNFSGSKADKKQLEG